MAYFEATKEQKQLATIGRDMMNYSEEYGKIHGLKAVTDNGMLSHVGNMLTQYGAPYGTTIKDFTDEDQALIASWMQKKVDIERK
jgi:hypothetical protein